MKNKFLLTFIIFFAIFSFFIFLKALNNSNVYIADNIFKENLVNFKSQELFSTKEISSEEIFKDSEFYILNIWASWCAPCRKEHPILMKLSQNSQVKMIGLNYKDNFDNARNFIYKFGNPYSNIITDKDGVISIGLGAYGVPETFIIDKNKKIIKKFIGPLSKKNLDKIILLIK